MNVDTGEFRALAGQAGELAALGRKISTLTGRVTVMGNHLNRLDVLVDDDLRVLVRVLVRVVEAYGIVPREPAVRTATRPRGHLRVINGGER